MKVKKILLVALKTTFRPTLVFLVISAFLLFQFAYSHELVHQTIFKDYGIDSRIEMFHKFPDRSILQATAVTIAEGNISNCKESCLLAHEINEVFAYQMIPISLIIFTGLLMIVMMLEYIMITFRLIYKDLKDEEKKNELRGV